MDILKLSPELLIKISENASDAVDAMNFAQATRTAHVANLALYRRISTVITFFQLDPNPFLTLLDSTGSVVTGSAAVWVGLLNTEAEMRQTRCDVHGWHPRTLDIICSTSNLTKVLEYFRMQNLEPIGPHAVDAAWKETAKSVHEIKMPKGHNGRRAFVILTDNSFHAILHRDLMDHTVSTAIPTTTSMVSILPYCLPSKPECLLEPLEADWIQADVLEPRDAAPVWYVSASPTVTFQTRRRWRSTIPDHRKCLHVRKTIGCPV
ncbi:hypothetical protein VKT23_012595 [Stygiomarasmius scandens]|uniref:Uncharacterized protein n=1 Tax=Marasmiellus scandens TaxID=2682957 RepID=A0ABR1J9M8_9AGAR